MKMIFLHLMCGTVLINIIENFFNLKSQIKKSVSNINLHIACFIFDLKQKKKFIGS